MLRDKPIDINLHPTERGNFSSDFENLKGSRSVSNYPTSKTARTSYGFRLQLDDLAYNVEKIEPSQEITGILQ